MPQSTLIRLEEVIKRTGLSRSWIYRLIDENRFPAQVKLGGRAMAFVESEIDQWIENRITESRGGKPE